MLDTGEIMYADVLFAENFIIDYLLLSMTARFSKLKTSKKRLSLGAAVGALYVMAVFFPSLKEFFSVIIKVAVSVLMIIIVFAPEKLRDMFKALGIFYIVSCAIGGAAFLFYFFTGRGYISNGIFYIFDFPVSLLVTAMAAGYMLLAWCWDYVHRISLNDVFTYGITIVMDKKQAQMNAIVDTGSSLKDPISGYPVIVTEYGVLKDMLPNCMEKLFLPDFCSQDLNQVCSAISNTDWAARIRLIPYSSIGKQNGMLIGIKPDVVRVKYTGYIREVDRVVVGICASRLSSDGDYQALFNPELLE